MVKNKTTATKTNSILTANSGFNLSSNKNSNQTSEFPLSPKKPFPYLKAVIYSFLFVILMLPVIIVIGQTLNPEDGILRSFKGGGLSSPEGYPFVNPTENCQVRNVNTSVDYMVPFRSAGEWSAFKSASVSLSDLSYNCTTCVSSCADKAGLAAVNDGFNCGLNLSDGCGGFMNCTSNCATNEVCAEGTPNSTCASGLLFDCDRALQQGHCKLDNGCIPVIDVPSVSSSYGRAGCYINGPFDSYLDACGAAPQISPWPAIFYRSGDCLAGDQGGVVVQPCSSQFGAYPYDSKFGMSDGINYQKAYFRSNWQTINACPQPPPPPPSGESVCMANCLYEGNSEENCQLICQDNEFPG